MITLNLKNKNFNNYNIIKFLYNKKDILKFFQKTISVGYIYSTKFNYIYSLKSFNKNILIKNLINYNKFIKINLNNKMIINKNFNKNFFNKNLLLFIIISNSNFLNINNLLNINFKFKSKGNKNTANQLLNFRGYVSNLSNNLLKIPIYNTFINGLDSFEFILSSYGARKGLVNTSLNVSDSGYLSKKIIEYANNIIIKEFDCKTNKNIIYKKYIINYKGNINKNFFNNILNKYIYIYFNIFFLKNINLKENTKYNKIFKFRNVLSCINIKNICSKCYNNFTNNYININLPIGILTSNSITEPITQMTLKVFHTGGLINLKNINNKYSEFKLIFNNKNIKNNLNYFIKFKYNKIYFYKKNIKNLYNILIFNSRVKKNNLNFLNNIMLNKFNNNFIIFKNFNNNWKYIFIKNSLNIGNFYKIVKYNKFIINYYIYNIINKYFISIRFNITYYNNILKYKNNKILNLKGYYENIII